MKDVITKIRGYGWYCVNCHDHKNLDKVGVVKIIQHNYMAMICQDCHTELVDCFIAKTHQDVRLNCDTCQDRFQCLTRADYVSEKELELVRNDSIHTTPMTRQMLSGVVGVRSYTGIYNDKLDTGDFCLYPTREDCNHSWMRSNYEGPAYKRCPYMKYDVDGKVWYCEYGRKLRENT